MIQVRKPKLIIDPLLGIVDITEVIPLIDVRPFQLLAFKYQLGLNSMIFPAATHTRKQHSLGAYERTRRLTIDWQKHNFINKEEALALQVYALYHDIGHGPFSHITERLAKKHNDNIEFHDQRGLQLIEGLKKEIESIGCNYSLVHDLFSRKNPLYLSVFDKNIGMEKLDYLDRDALYTIGERPGVDYIAKHVYYIDKKIMIDEVALDQAKDIQDFYIKMSKNVYLRKKSSILQRLIEKMTYFLVEDENIDNETLFDMTDFGLLGRYEASNHSRINFYYDRFVSGNIPKLTLEFKHQFASSADLTHKPMRIFNLEDNVFDKLISSNNLKDLNFLSKLEDDLANLTGVPKDNLVVVPPFSRKRFEPEDILVYGREGKVQKLSEIYPSHFQAMKEYGRSHLSLRIAVYDDYRRKLYDQSDKVKDYLLANL